MSAAATPPRRARTAAILAAVLAVFFSPALLGSGQFLFRDDGRMHHPMKTFVASELRAGRIAAWNPYGGLGTPVVACAADAPLHPFNVLLLALPFEAAFKAWVLLSFVAAAFGVRAWTRALGAREPGALAAGLGYALSGFLVSASDNVTYLAALAAAPWLLAAGARVSERARPGRLAAVGAASFLCAAAGDPQGWGIAVALLAIQPPLLAPRGRRVAAAARGALAAAVAVGFAAPVVLPILEWLPHSMRAGSLEAGGGKWDLAPVRLVELAIPGVFDQARRGDVSATVYGAFATANQASIPWLASIYGGVSVLALAALGAAPSPAPASADGARRARLLLVGAAAFLWMALGAHGGFGAIARALPVLRSLRYWEKLLAWPALFAATAAGLGLDRFLRDPGRRFAVAVGAIAAPVLAAGVAVLLFPDPFARVLGRHGHRALAAVLAGNLGRGALAAGAVLAVLALAAAAAARGHLSRLAPAALVAIVALDLVSANVRGYLLSPPEIARPPSAIARFLAARPEPARVVTNFALAVTRWPELLEFESAWRWGAATLAPAWNVAARVGNIGSYTSMPPRRLIEVQTRAGPGTLAPVAGLWGFGYAVVPGTVTLASKIGLPAPPEVVAADLSLPAFVVAVAHRPRAYLAREVVRTDEAGALAFALAPGAVEDPRTVVEAPMPPGLATGEGTVRIAVDEPQRVELDVAADAPSLVVLNDQDAPGWTARVDGAPAPIVTANLLARGVFVGAGRHRIVFAYRTPGLAAGACAAGAAAAALAAWAALRRRGRSRRAAAPEAAEARAA